MGGWCGWLWLVIGWVVEMVGRSWLVVGGWSGGSWVVVSWHRHRASIIFSTGESCGIPWVCLPYEKCGENLKKQIHQ